MDPLLIYLILGCIFGLWMTWGVGANDLANVMSTTMGSKAITPRQAVFIAIVFEFAGALLGGGGVSETMRSGIINMQSLADQPNLLALGMLSVLIASTVWINFAAFLGVPVSITNSIVGSVVGFGTVVLGFQAIHWDQVGKIAISWFTAPTIAGIFALLLFRTIQHGIFAKANIVSAAKRYIPIYLFLVSLVLAFITVFKAMNHYNVHPGWFASTIILLSTASLIVIISLLRLRAKVLPDNARRQQRFAYVEQMFALLTALTACAMVFAHGSNDVAVAVGPIMVILAIYHHANDINAVTAAPYWIILLGCTGVVLGLFMYGRKVIETVGSGITALTPSRAFAATFSAASTVVVSTSIGIPVSTTQTLVGAVLGVGLARGIGALNLNVIRNIILSWVITIPVASLLTITFYYLIKIVVT